MILKLYKNKGKFKLFSIIMLRNWKIEEDWHFQGKDNNNKILMICQVLIMDKQFYKNQNQISNLQTAYKIQPNYVKSNN